jgi:hypothetical protein
MDTAKPHTDDIVHQIDEAEFIEDGKDAAWSRFVEQSVDYVDSIEGAELEASLRHVLPQRPPRHPVIDAAKGVSVDTAKRVGLIIERARGRALHR